MVLIMRYLLFLLLLVTSAHAQTVAVYHISNDTASTIHKKLTAKGKDYFFLKDTNGNYLIPAAWWGKQVANRTGKADTIQFNQLKDGRPVPYKYSK